MRHAASPLIPYGAALERQIEALAPAAGKAPTPRRPLRSSAAAALPWRAPAAEVPAAPPPRPMAAPLRPAPRKTAPPRQQGHEALARETRLAAQERETSDGPGAPRTGPAPPHDAGSRHQPTEQEDREGGEDAAAGWAAQARGGAGPDDLSPAALAALLPGAHTSGVFEVMLPDGDTLAVAVDAGPQGVCYLLQAGSERLAARLRRQQMELTAQVERRIGRSVRLTVL